MTHDECMRRAERLAASGNRYTAIVCEHGVIPPPQPGPITHLGIAPPPTEQLEVDLPDVELLYAAMARHLARGTVPARLEDTAYDLLDRLAAAYHRLGGT